MVSSVRSLASAASKKRQWADGGVSRRGGRCKTRLTLLARCAVFEGDTDCESLDLEPDEAPAADCGSLLLHALPDELLALVLAPLDGQTLLACAAACRALRSLTFDRGVWKRLCLLEWPTLRSQLLPQLPGAPDYDVRALEPRHAREQRVDMTVQLPRFGSADAMRGVDKVVSDTFQLGSHRFCLWIFPNGNPNEAAHAGRVLSVYLVLTDLTQRPPDWLTCAVFSLQVANTRDPTRQLAWHSSLADNKFHRQLNNWGVHSLGALSMLRDPREGYLSRGSGASDAAPDTLTVSTHVRLMTITFRVAFERDLHANHQLGLVDLARVAELELPFCCSLEELLVALHRRFPELLGSQEEAAKTQVWCFNQPVVSGQALRPRKLLTHAKAKRDRPLFGHLLCDGVDIDAYSFCQLYVQSSSTEELPLEPPASEPSDGFVFVKLLHPDTRRLDYLGKVRYPSAPGDDLAAQDTAASFRLAPAVLYEAVARRTGWNCEQLTMFREEIAPTVLSKPIPHHLSAQDAALQPADIAVFCVRPRGTLTVSAVSLQPLFDLLLERCDEAQQLLADGGLSPPTLESVETLAEKLDIPKFRVRSAFRKCHEDARATLRYIMAGRHLGFICDACGETDFTGARFNCAVCSDYDLCSACHGRHVSHRYANVDGKWQRVYNFQDHSGAHAMRRMLPVFHGSHAQQPPPSQHT
ncbi:hypothetical protein BBJ28_00006702 [Nothophytophthora sp. Chile5]|nr:hypothetical protein BBJ28_00006702 [Nothophytophthora sp. Chile5]